MDVSPSRQDSLTFGLYPTSLREHTRNFTSLQSYIYIVEQTTVAHDGEEARTLLKVGFSNIRTRRGEESGLTRLFSLRTATISLTVHRLYLYEGSPTDSALAHKAEQKLHELLTSEMRPRPERILFTNNNPTEWFFTEDIPKFLHFCDQKVFHDITPHILAGTKFSETSFELINPPRDPKIVGMTRKSRKVQLANHKRNLSPKSQRYAMSLRQARSMDRQRDRQKELRAQERLKRRKLAKNTAFWKDVFVKTPPLQFRDSKMYLNDSGKLPLKKIVDVVYINQPVIVYEPIIKETRRRKFSQEERDTAGGYLSVNEALDMFPKIKQKYRASYDFYKEQNNFEDELDYGDLV